MSRSLGRRILDFLWGPAEYDEDYAGEDEADVGRETPDPYATPSPEPPPRAWHTRGSAPPRTEDVTELRPPRQPRATVRFPRQFKDAMALAEQYKQGACLIVDLSQVQEKDKEPIVNFLSGVAFGRDGHSEKVNNQTFIFAPRHFDLQREDPHAAADPGYVPRFTVNL